MNWVKYWEEEKYDLTKATVTICCKGMEILVRSVTFSGERLWLMEMSQVPWRAILSIEYCPHCGKKVQVEAWK